MGRADYYKPGSWNAICYECGFKRKGDELLRYWQGYFLCERCWNPRQPQDFARTLPDNPTPPWTQPQPAWVFGLDSIIMEGTGTDFIPEEPLMTETNFQPLFLEQ